MMIPGGPGPEGHRVLRRQLPGIRGQAAILACRSGGCPGMPAPEAGPRSRRRIAADAMIEMKVDPSKLPKAEELKALMFPGTLAVAVDDQAIRIVSREAFPNIVGGIGGGAVGTALLLPAIQAARAKAAGGGLGGPAPPAPAGQPARGRTPGGTPAGPARRREGRVDPAAEAFRRAQPGGGGRGRPARLIAAEPERVDPSIHPVIEIPRARLAARRKRWRAWSRLKVPGDRVLRCELPATIPPAGSTIDRPGSGPHPGPTRSLHSQRIPSLGEHAMEIVNEVTAHLENKPGRLAKICSALAQEKVDIRAITVMETEGPSVLRFVTSDLETTKKVLTSLGTEHTVSEVLAVQLESRTGALAKVLERLADEHINIDYAYASSASTQGKALGIFHTNNTKRALQVLGEAAGNSAEKAAGRRPLHSR